MAHVSGDAAQLCVQVSGKSEGLGLWVADDVTVPEDVELELLAMPKTRKSDDLPHVEAEQVHPVQGFSDVRHI